MSSKKIFLLSPANCGGKRATLVTRHGAAFELAVRLRSPGGAPLGEVFAFLSGLYFRGKLAYADRFGDPPAEAPSTLVITSSRGLLSPDELITPAVIDEFACTSISLREPRYAEPLVHDVTRLGRTTPAECRFVLLGSVASDKYVAPLTRALGDRLLFPPEFAGMGDMQRGSLLLRAAAAGEELEYRPVQGALLSRAVRPPRRA